MIAAVAYEPGAVWELRVSDDEKTCVLWTRNVLTGEESEREFTWCKCEGEPKGHPQVMLDGPDANRIVRGLVTRVHDAIWEAKAN